MFRSRSFTLFTMRVGLLHLGQSVLLEVSITFLRSAVLAILAMSITLLFRCVVVHSRTESGPLRVSASKRFACEARPSGRRSRWRIRGTHAAQISPNPPLVWVVQVLGRKIG